MGGPPVGPRLGETKESITSRPGYKEARDLLEVINQSLQRTGVKIEEILSKDNPYVDELLRYAKGLEDDGKKNPTDKAPVFADIDHITDVTHKDGILILHYQDNPDLNQEIIKGEKIYNAIFWAEIKREQERIALKAKEAEAQRIKQKTKVAQRSQQSDPLGDVVPPKEIDPSPDLSLESDLEVESKPKISDSEELESSTDGRDFRAEEKKVKPSKEPVKPKSKEIVPGKFEIEMDGKDFIDTLTGFRIRIFMPKGFDGNVDMFFPGDTYTIEKALKSIPLREKWIEKCQKGSRSALVVIEGDAKAIHGNKPARYQKLKREGAFRSIVNTFNTNTHQNISDVHISGHSRGGSALNMLTSTGEGMGLIKTVSYFDATYWSATPLIAFARRGGSLNIAFKPGTKTEGPAMKLIQELGLKKVASGYWKSDDGKVNVHAAPTLSHSQIPQQYFGPFIGTTAGKEVASFSGPAGTSGPTFEKFEETFEKPGDLHGTVLKRVETVDKTIVEQDFKKISDSNIEDIRFNSNLLTGGNTEEEKAKNLKEETARRLKTYTSAYDGKWYTINYAKLGADSKGRSHEQYIGLGDVLLDPDIKDILVERGGQVIKAHRGIVSQEKKHGGRHGFLDDNGNYVYTHTNDRFRILSAGETNLGDSAGLKSYLASVKQEETGRVSSKSTFEANPSAFAHDPGYYAGPTIDHYEFKPENYPKEYLQRIKRYGRDGLPPELPKDQIDVPMMGYGQALKYYERMCGRPPRAGWSVRKLNVFGTTVGNPNIILACLLVELEERCKQLGMGDLKFNYLTSTAPKPGFHGLGMAIDFDPGGNWVNRPNQTTWDLPLAFSNELQKMGFRWGMYFYKSRKDGKTDAMHFDVRTSLPNVIQMLTSKRAQDLAKSFNVPGKGISLYEYGASLSGKIH